MTKETGHGPTNHWIDLESDWKDALAPSGGERLTGCFDGASRGNPGPAGAGAALLDGRGEILWRCAEPLGERTNNEAEYLALILLLEEADRRGASVDIRGDSQLVVNQVTGRWKIKEPRLALLASDAVALLRKTGSTLTWVPRDRNALADDLSNRALDGPAENRQAFAPAGRTFDPERLEKMTETLFIAHGTEDYAVDLLHGACTCPAFQRSRRCKHLDAAQKHFAK